MELIHRSLTKILQEIRPPKAIVIFGPRRVGKTTLLRQISATIDATWFTGDSTPDIRTLNIPATDDLKGFLTRFKAIVIDEAQRIPDIGLLLKRLVDINETLENPVAIYVTGSSSFDLARGVKETALGRIREFELGALSCEELANETSWGTLGQNIRWHLIYGMYPEVCTNPQSAKDILLNHCNSLLYKEIFTLGGIRLNDKFEHLVQYLAYNIGSVISYDNVSREVGLNKGTVAEYVRLLEQSFIVRCCPSYAKNLSNELKKGKKIYFCDNGIRNAVINDFSPIATRQDAGALWENFVFTERLKFHGLKRDYSKIYFWRTSERSPHEIDFIEITDGKMTALECKLSEEKNAKLPLSFQRAYPNCPLYTASPGKIQNLWKENAEKSVEES